MTMRKVSVAMLAAGLMLGAATVATAHDHATGQMGHGMMGQMRGMGPAGPLMGPSMMAPGQMAPGMMGQGMGPGMGHRGMTGPMGGLRITPSMHLTTDDVRHSLEHHLTQHGFEHLKVGEVTQTDPDTITADVVTTEGSLAVRLQVDTHTGWIKDLS
jgi:hypothetical protein